jgi:hypothetical protein
MPGPWNSQGKGRRTRQGKEVIVSIHNHGYTNWMWDWTWTCSLVYHQLFRLLVGRGDVGSSIMYYRWIPCIACICGEGTKDEKIWTNKGSTRPHLLSTLTARHFTRIRGHVPPWLSACSRRSASASRKVQSAVY